MILDATNLALLIPILAIGGGLSIAFVGMLTQHKRKLVEMQMKGGGMDNSVRAELNALREEVRALRDTSMQYDLSFDNSLQRMEQRMSSVERRVNAPVQEDSQNIQIGR